MCKSFHCAVLSTAALLLLSPRAYAQLDPNAFTSLGTLNVTSGTLGINTDTGVISGVASFTGITIGQTDGPPIAVFDFSSISIGSGVTLSLTGSRPLALLSRGSVTINPSISIVGGSFGGYGGGFIDANNTFGTYLAPGFGPGGGGAATFSAGGGGYGGVGGNLSIGGVTYGSLLQTLQGGSGGGVSLVTQTATGPRETFGGAGGGAIEIISVGNLTVSSISVNGTNSASGGFSNDISSGGGGSGGAILLSSETGALSGATLNASGGNGGNFNSGSGGGGGGGRIVLGGISSYTLGSISLTSGFSTFNTNLNGGSGTSASNFGAAGVITVDAQDTTIPGGVTLTLDGSLLTSVQGSSTQTGPTIDAFVRHSAVINTGATVKLGMNNALQQLDASGNNITEVSLFGTLDLNGYNESIDTLLGLAAGGTLNIPASSTLTVGISNSVANGGGSLYNGQFTGSGTIVKAGTGTLTLQAASSFSGSTIVGSGTLSLTNNLCLQNSTVTLSGGTLSFSGSASPVFGALAGTGNQSLSGLTTLTVGGNNSSTIYSGNLSGSPSVGLIKSGTGNWTLTGANTQSGSFGIQAGTLLVGSAGALSSTAPITVSAGATLDLNDFNYSVTPSNPINVQGTLRLSGGSLTVTSGASATYSGAALTNGFLLGSGTQTLTGGTSLTGIATSASVMLNQTGPTSVSNFANNGQFNNAAGQSLIWSNGTNTSAGRLSISGAVSANDFLSTGVITIGAGGALNNSGSNLVLGGGSRTTINASGMLSAAAGTTIELNGGLLVNNGTIMGTTDVNFGSLAKGTGSYGVVNIGQGGIYAPGNSPGIVTAAAVTFDNTPVNSGAPQLQIELGGTTPGTQYDQLHVTGQLSLGGILQVSLVNGFSPAADASTSFDILDWGALSGKFTSVQLPTLTAPMGWDLSNLYTTGVITATSFLKGDINRDGIVTVADIAALMDALSDLNTYQSSHAGMNDLQHLLEVADLNGDSQVTNADVQALSSLLANIAQGSGALTAVPEPAAVLLFVLALPAAVAARWRQLRHRNSCSPLLSGLG